MCEVRQCTGRTDSDVVPSHKRSRGLVSCVQCSPLLVASVCCKWQTHMKVAVIIVNRVKSLQHSLVPIPSLHFDRLLGSVAARLRLFNWHS